MIGGCRSLIVFLLLAGFVAEARADWIDQFVEGQLAKRHIPGLSIAVLRDGKVVKAAGYGRANLELQTPATAGTVYEIGSISKQFASEAVMLLVEDGKIGLDDLISKYLPNTPETWQKITIRQLMNHTAGLKDWTEVKGFSYRRDYTADEFIDLIRSFPLQYQPGESWAYSNTGPPLLGIIVEKASGKTYEDFVTERINKPLGLPSIRFRHQEDIVPNRATGYEFANGVFTNGEPFRPRIIAPSGGILASALDLAKWFESIFQGRIVKPATLDQMLTPTRPADGRNITHGFALFTDSFNGHKMIFHHGSTVGGFGSVVRYFPQEKITIAVIGNLEDGGWGPDYLIKRIANVYIPGAFIGGIKGGIDPNPAVTKQMLQLLRDLGSGKDSDTLTASYRPRVSAEIKQQAAENLKTFRSFTYLAQEQIGSNHFVLDPTLVKAVHYKLVSSSRTVYYTFRLNRDGQVGFILVDE